MLTALLLSASAATIPIHVGRFNPADFPNAEMVARQMPHGALNIRAENILRSRQCSINGQNKDQYDIVVPYAVQLQPTGAAIKVVVKEIGCIPIERLVGEVAAELSKHGDFKPKHQIGEKWYVGEIYFTRASHQAIGSMEDQDKVVCREKDTTGSRLRKVRVCRTVAQWKLFGGDTRQLRRDMNGHDPMVVEE
jgi:hypothetical protein